jgi:hypothetical protein
MPGCCRFGPRCPSSFSHFLFLRSGKVPRWGFGSRGERARFPSLSSELRSQFPRPPPFIFVRRSESGSLLLGLHLGTVAFDFGSVLPSASKDCFDFLWSEWHPISLPSWWCFSVLVILFDSRFGESYYRWKLVLFLIR